LIAGGEIPSREAISVCRQPAFLILMICRSRREHRPSKAAQSMLVATRSRIGHRKSMVAEKPAERPGITTQGLQAHVGGDSFPGK